MMTDDAMEIIFSSPQYRELVEVLEETKETLSPDEWQEISHTLMNDIDGFVTHQIAETSELVEGKTFRA